MLSHRCLFVCLTVLSVTSVYCVQTVRWIKMKLGTQVGLGPGHIVLDGDTAPPPQRGTAPSNFRPSVVAKWLDGSRCHLVGGRPRPKRHCVRWEPSSPPQKGDRFTQFSAHVYYGQTAGWMKMPLGMELGLGPGHIVLDWDPATLLRKGRTAPNFQTMSVVAKRLDGSRCHLVLKWASAMPPCVRGGPSPPPPAKAAQQLPIFGPCLLWPRWSISATAELLLFITTAAAIG